MLNEKKIALMTKMAIYEQGEGKKSFPMSKYYRSDYLSLRLINATIVVRWHICWLWQWLSW